MTATRRDMLKLFGYVASTLAAARGALLATADAEAGEPSGRYFALLRDKDTLGFGLAAIAEDEKTGWRTEVASRMHSGAIKPHGHELAVVARRPGTFFIVIDVRDGRLMQTITLSGGRISLGHAVFSEDGDYLFVAEAIAETGEGCIGIYDTRRQYQRTGEWKTHGLDPHEIVLSSDRKGFWVANGGLDLHVESGRRVLNDKPFKSTLVHLNSNGDVDCEIALGKDLQSLSIRHLTLHDSGEVFFGCQDQGREDTGLPLVGRAASDGRFALFPGPSGSWAGGSGYVGSVALDAGGTILAATCPRANRIVFQDIAAPGSSWEYEAIDACGVAPERDAAHFVVSTGTGRMLSLHVTQDGPLLVNEVASSVNWDNHIIGRR